MLSNLEREAFSTRLCSLLQQSGYPSSSPTWLAKEFNQRYEGVPVTLHAVRKWLQGDAIPSQDKIRALAAWFGVSPEWLRYGEPEGEKEESAAARRQGNTQAGEPDLSLWKRISSLSPEHRQVVDDLVASLHRLEHHDVPKQK